LIIKNISLASITKGKTIQGPDEQLQKKMFFYLKLIEVTLQDLQFLYVMEQQCQQPDIKVNAVRIVSTIGCMFAKILQPHPFLKVGKM
jgi:hypothetical protein